MWYIGKGCFRGVQTKDEMGEVRRPGCIGVDRGEHRGAKGCKGV